jgi:hypothetical protein
MLATSSDRNEPLAIQHSNLNDRQLESEFKRVCDISGIGNWVCGSDMHFDVTPGDIRCEIDKIVANCDPGLRGYLELEYVLRLIAWNLELGCVTEGKLGA